MHAGQIAGLTPQVVLSTSRRYCDRCRLEYFSHYRSTLSIDDRYELSRSMGKSDPLSAHRGNERAEAPHGSEKSNKRLQPSCDTCLHRCKERGPLVRKILPWINVNGQDVEQDKAMVSVGDAGLLYGYGVFTTLKIKKGIPLFWEQHVQRLLTGAERLAFGKLPAVASLKERVVRVVRKNKVCDGTVRITLTPGRTPGLSDTTVIIHATLPHEPVASVDAIIMPDQRDALRDIKGTNRVMNMLADREASRQGAQVAIFTDQEGLVEATTSNIIGLDHGGTFITPPLEKRGLCGICRGVLLEQGYIKTGAISAETQGPLFLVNSLSVIPIRFLNHRELLSAAPYLETLQAHIERLENQSLHAFAFKESLASVR